MINRVLIRIRVVQILYSCYLGENRDLKKAETDLMFSLQKSYDLYFYFLQLMVELTTVYEKKIDIAKNKFLPTEEDLNPNTKLIENKFIAQLKNSQPYIDFFENRPLAWDEHDGFVKNLLEQILESDIYREYLAEEGSYDSDQEFWRKVFKSLICANETLADILEEESIFWNDDVEIVESFVLKTIKKITPDKQPFLPMFRDSEDSEYAIKLLRETMLNVVAYRELISKYAKNWESERIAFMDLVIMQTAVAELLNFPTIPVSVTLNEYINISKSYSTNKSASFINGILDSIVSEFKESNRLLKK